MNSFVFAIILTTAWNPAQFHEPFIGLRYYTKGRCEEAIQTLLQEIPEYWADDRDNKKFKKQLKCIKLLTN